MSLLESIFISFRVVSLLD